MTQERRRRQAPARKATLADRRWQIAGFVLACCIAAVVGPYTYLARTPIRRHDVRLTVPAPASGASAARPVGLTRHVIIISVDGLRTDAITRYAPPTILRIMREGASTLDARTIDPSLTLPSHTSMLTGTLPAVHGITWNTDLTIVKGKHLPVPTIFGIARTAGLTTAAFFSKSKFHHLEDPLELDYSQSPNGGLGKILGFRTAEDVERHLESARPDLTFVHLGDADYAGHFFGWMTPPYGRAVRAADAAAARVLASATRAFGAGNFVVILTADHGGSGRHHAAVDIVNRRIPWMAWGKGVVPAAALGAGIRTMDTAATALWLLGIPLPAHIVGRPVAAAFATSPPSPPPGVAPLPGRAEAPDAGLPW